MVQSEDESSMAMTATMSSSASINAFTRGAMLHLPGILFCSKSSAAAVTIIGFMLHWLFFQLYQCLHDTCLRADASAAYVLMQLCHPLMHVTLVGCIPNTVCLSTSQGSVLPEW